MDAVLELMLGTSRSGGDGAVSVTGTAIGGHGGKLFAPAGRTGKGASIDLSNKVDGTTTGSLSLKQVAIGGDAGDAIQVAGEQSVEIGLAGSASSSLIHTSNASRLTLESQATGGKGGNKWDAHFAAGNGANATVIASGTKTGDGEMLVTGRATGGQGGSNRLVPPIGVIIGGDGGRGGDATSFSSGSNNGSGDVAVHDFAIGGAGGIGATSEKNARAMAARQQVLPAP